MEDNQIVDLYWARFEKAISETSNKYGHYCYYIAYNILHSKEDSEECVNDTYLNAWNAMPDQRPNILSAFLGRITRNLSLQRWEKYTAQKRGAGQVPLALDELQDCIPATDKTVHIVDDLMLADLLNRFLASLTAEKRIIFMRRYWYLCPVAEIASDFAISESKVKMSLLRSRNELKLLLTKEGIDL
ncbi:RNA polymerase sigma factor [Butyrivibrio sp. XBB1001]|uniref:RNA polymerase sigma factor n=1 Tax=Butyrivibrio sp. XBB1001 TaxID=1280682 RepID=UPI00041E0A87|nr:RNA polymerase sigma factor [Butyrivibrio sp. XBB1001]